MFKELIQFVEDSKDQPFFLYWANPIPHVPIQAPQRWVDYYVNKFGDEEPYLGDQGYCPSRYPHATFAGMVSYMDEQVGLLVDKLKELGLYDNTIIMFTSDNGAGIGGGSTAEWFDSAKPFISERGRIKGTVYEGGIRVPMIASWPGKIKAGSESSHPSAFYDVLPTLCDLTSIETPDDTDGISFLPTLLGNEQQPHDFLYWEFPSYGGQQAVRFGDWKAIRRNILKDGNTDIELFNLADDIQEQNNVADEYPEIVKQMKEIMEREHVPAEIERFRMAAIGD
jgi:arylsulfatase